MRKMKIKLAEFNVEDVEKALDLEPHVSMSEDLEAGKVYEYADGMELALQNGSISFITGQMDWTLAYLNFIDEIEENNARSEAIEVGDAFFDRMGLEDMKLVGSAYVDVDTLINTVYGGEDLIQTKDGQEINLRDEASDIDVLKYVKSIDGLDLVDERIDLANARSIIETYSYIIVKGESISYVDIRNTPDELLESDEVEIISPDGAEEIFVEDRQKAVEVEDFEIEGITLKYGTEPAELANVIFKPIFTYIPLYELEVKNNYMKGDQEDIYMEKVYIDAINGSILR